MNLSPLNRRRFELFKANKRGWWSLWLFLILFGLSLGAELIANDKPLVVHYDDGWYFPALKRYPETTFGGEFPWKPTTRAPTSVSCWRPRTPGCCGHRFRSATRASTTT